LKDVLDVALDQARSYYAFSKLPHEEEVKIPRRAVVVTPYGLFHKVCEDGGYYHIGVLPQISYRGLKELSERISSKFFKFQLVHCLSKKTKKRLEKILRKDIIDIETGDTSDLLVEKAYYDLNSTQLNLYLIFQEEHNALTLIDSFPDINIQIIGSKKGFPEKKKEISFEEIIIQLEKLKLN